MAKIDPLSDVGSLANTTSARAVINANAQRIEEAFDNTLSRDGSGPNEMHADIDLNEHHLLNVADPVADMDGVNLRSVRGLVDRFAGEIVSKQFLGSVTVVNDTALPAQTTINLPSHPGTQNNVEVFIDGVALRPSLDFTLNSAGTQLTLVTPLSGGETVLVRYAGAIPAGLPDDPSLRPDLAATSGLQTGAQLVGYAPGVTVAARLDKLDVQVDGAPYFANSPLLTPTQRVAAIHAAQDAAIAAGVALVFGPHTYETASALKFKSTTHWKFAGIDQTVFKLADSAPVGTNVMQPDTYDGSVENVTFEGGFTVDGNYARLAPGTFGVDRPGDSGFVTGGARNLRIIGGAKAIDCVLHGIDITGGGEVEGGQRYYTAPGNQSRAPAYYPPNSTDGFYADYLEAANNGDDGITVHTARNVFVDEMVVTSAGHRHTSVNASNCVEFDDSSRDCWVGSIRATGGIAGVEIKTHGTDPAPHNINIGTIHATGCRRGVSAMDGAWTTGDPAADAYGIRIGTLFVENPADPRPGSTELVHAAAIQNYRDVNIERIIARATGTEPAGFMHAAVRLYSGYKDTVIGSIDVENWAYDNASDTLIGAFAATSTGSGFTVGSIRAKNTGYRAVALTATGPYSIGEVVAEGAGLASSIAVRSSVKPGATARIGPVVASGYTTATSYESGEASSRGKAWYPGDLGTAGRLYAGVAAAPTYHHIAATDLSTAGDEVLRIGGANVVANFFERGAGGSFGANSANAIFKVATMATTGRSINAGGTINQSGADYAEYFRVIPRLYGCVAPGTVLGVRADGTLTDTFAEVVGPFLVKSTKPGLVGGDAWGTEEAICALYSLEPVGDEPPSDDPSACAAWQSRKQAFEAAYEEERAKWDRMAVAGQVPVNTEALFSDVGKYLVPVENTDGGIALEAVAASVITTAQLATAIGRIIRIEDSRPIVLVR